jgi:Family of unknown function (DUF6311)
MHSSRIVGFLLTSRRLPTLLLISLVLALAHAALLFPPAFVLGTSDYWRYPAGIVAGAENDMAGVLAGYLYSIQSPWSFPIFYTPYLQAPTGASVVWSDAMPIVVLAGKVVHGLTGQTVNLLGLYAVACYALLGPFVTWVLAVAGQRHVLAAVAGTAFAVTMPILYWRWGHLSSSAQFLLPGALALYLCTVRMPDRRRFTMLWAGYLVLVLSFNNYLLVMAGAVFAAALAQRSYDGVDKPRNGAAMAAAVGVTLVLVMYAFGLVGKSLGHVASFGFGRFSMNLLAPVYPQGSGLFGGERVLDATGGQHEGYAYLGAGLLLATLIVSPLLWRWLRENGKRHLMLLAVLAGSCAFAISHRVFLGDTLIVELPLNRYVAAALGAFRSSGRFIWLPEYALLCAVLVLGLRYVERRGRNILLICLVAVLIGLQFFDTGPLRHAIAANLRQPLPAILDRAAIVDLVGRARAIRIYPSFACIPAAKGPVYRQANVEFQLAGAPRVVPINSFFHGRAYKDCAEEARERSTETLQAGVLYVYLDGRGPDPARMPDGSAARFCGDLNWARYCLIPGPAN